MSSAFPRSRSAISSRPITSTPSSGRARGSLRHRAAAPRRFRLDPACRREPALSAAMVARALSLRQGPAGAQPRTRRARGRGGLMAARALEGRHAAVTGAGRGIGAAIARAAGRRGRTCDAIGEDPEPIGSDGGGSRRARSSRDGGYHRCRRDARGASSRRPHLRTHRHPRQQRRPGAKRADAPGARGAVAQHDRGESHGHLSRHSRRACRP